MLLLELLGTFGSFLTLLGLGLWLWMIIDCVQNESDRQTWLLILVFLNILGGLVYFGVRWWPRNSGSLGGSWGRWTRQHQLWEAEAAARSIGKAYQFINLGNLLLEFKDYEKAGNAFASALEKEPENLQALWGATAVAMKQKQFEIAQTHLKQLLKLDPEYKFGEASSIYGQVLWELKDLDAARDHLENHVKSWGQPQSYLNLAKVQVKQGDAAMAKETLETMLIKLRGSPGYHYRRNRHWIRQAESMLKTLR